MFLDLYKKEEKCFMEGQNSQILFAYLKNILNEKKKVNEVPNETVHPFFAAAEEERR